MASRGRRWSENEGPWTQRVDRSSGLSLGDGSSTILLAIMENNQLESSRSVSPRLNARCVVGISLVSSLAVAEPAAAHTGLGAHSWVDGAIHPFLGLDHLLAMLAVGILAAIARDRRVGWLTPIGFVVGMVVGGALGIAGVGFPGTELAIGVSVIALGVLIATVRHDAGLWLVVLAAMFGAIHGHAHGAELPADAVRALYVVGFVVATGALHFAGAGFGVAMRNSNKARTITAAAMSGAGIALLIGA